MLKDAPSTPPNSPVLWMQRQHQQDGRYLRTLLSEFNPFKPLSDYDHPLDFKDLSTEKVQEYTQIIMDETNKTFDQIAQLQDSDLSFETVFRPQIELGDKLARLHCMATQMAQFSPNKALRDACNEAKEKLSDFNIETFMRRDVFDRVNTYHEHYFPHEKHLTEEEALLVNNTMVSYQRDGLTLDDDTQTRIKTLKKDIEKKCILFNKNLDDVDTYFTFKREQLVGLPESWFSDDKKMADNLWKVTLKYPDYFAVMDYAQNREVRKIINTAFDGRCKDENTELFNETVKLRQELATLLGYQQYSDYQLELKMAGTTSYVMNFLNDLYTKVTPLLKKDLEAFRQLAIQETNDSNFQLEPWDLRYYARINKEKLCDLDQNQIRQYFPLKAVTEGMMHVYEKLLGLKFVFEPSDNTWDKSVQLYRVYNFDHKQQVLGDAIGSFYLDMYPREGKYGHAAVFDFIGGGDVSNITSHPGDRQLPVMAMACNFPEKECLAFDDVVTLFHEFGHVMHGICSKTQISSLGSFAVQEDFIEAPSQMLEFWCYSSDVLKLMSKHIETNEPISDELIKKLVQENNVNQGYICARQLSFGLFDMAMHTHEIASQNEVDSQAQWASICQQVMGIKPEPSTSFPASFGHLMGGYEAGYYGYMMSLTYATDMFYTLFKGNELDPSQGKRYRECILEPGGSKDAIELIRNFLGREPNNEAFLKDKGLETDEVRQQRKIKMT